MQNQKREFFPCRRAKKDAKEPMQIAEQITSRKWDIALNTLSQFEISSLLKLVEAPFGLK